MKARIIIFAKAPVAGFAKTRLIAALGAHAAAQLAQRMLAHTLNETLATKVHKLELCMTPNPSDAMWQALSLPEKIELSDQGSGDLGERLARAALRANLQGEAVILIGTDCPALDASELNQALLALEKNDAVIIPTEDGGYALLGFKNFHSNLFTDIQWSSSSVAQETIKRMAAMSWTIAQRPRLHDIDEAQDLQWLPQHWPEAIANKI